MKMPPLSMLLQKRPKIVLSTTVRPSDLSTSQIIAPDVADQIRCGKTAPKVTRDVVYSRLVLPNGSKKSLALDIQQPEGGGRHPLVIYLTGGGFVMSPKESAFDQRTFVTQQGFVVASVQYRTVGDGATYADTLADVKSAIRYLRAHADAYGIDPDHVGIWGESAGGYLAAMVGVTGDVKTFDKGENLDQSSRVQTVIDKFGTSDMNKTADDLDAQAKATWAQADNPIAAFVAGPGGGVLVNNPVAAGPANPITYVNGSTPPFLLFHGDDDRLISPTQTLMLHQALRASGVDSTRYVLKGAGHGDMAFLGLKKSGLPWTTNQTVGVMVDFLHRTLGR
jgi:acetyl esterase/lipase